MSVDERLASLGLELPGPYPPHDPLDAVVVHSGRAALEAAERFRPHVALLDIGMPELSGYDIASRIRAAPWGAQVTLIAVTGWGQEEDRRRALSSGFDRHLVKPIDPVLLEQLLREIAAGGNLRG